MISICIPVYNYDIGELLQELRRQGKRLSVPVEIIVIDDASDPAINAHNQRQQHLADQFITLPKNIGRSAIRNLFIDHAQFQYLLFLDCDVIPMNEQFLATYVHQLEKQPEVVYGGRVFPDNKTGANQRLRWAYGKYIESKPAIARQDDPYRHFHSNNFLIRKSIFQSMHFDEQFAGYGYEDSLFALRLKQSGISIVHIDNAVLNLQIESNQAFLDQVDESMRNLVCMQQQVDMRPVVSLVNSASRYRWMTQIIPAATRQYIRHRLAQGSANLRLFQLYKLLSYHAAAGGTDKS